MELKPMNIDLSVYPVELKPIITDSKLFDSSCSPEAKVIYIDKDGGYFLKSALKGALKQEAIMTNYFYSKGLSEEVLLYISNENDWLLTKKVPGEDGVAQKYLEQPERLVDIFAERLYMLHHTDFAGCPVQNHTERYIASAKSNYYNDHYDKSLFPDNWGYKSAEEAFGVLEHEGYLLKTDTLLHGDFCLPNIILNEWKFSGFIDVDCGGVGDRHVDLFWALWTLFFNLKTNKYRERFIDVYGRENVNEEYLRIVAAAEVFG
jgi:kanamycin kinase